MKASYLQFGVMILTSTVLMFILTYVNTYEIDHIFYSQTRTWMAIVMGAAMAIVMLVFMRGMYRNRMANAAIVLGSLLVLGAAVWLVRSQATVGDVAYMRAMIPHHSIAILTSRAARIRDPRVRELADGIIAAQVREIGEMKALIADIEANPLPATAPVLPAQ